MICEDKLFSRVPDYETSEGDEPYEDYNEKGNEDFKENEDDYDDFLEEER